MATARRAYRRASRGLREYGRRAAVTSSALSCSAVSRTVGEASRALDDSPSRARLRAAGFAVTTPVSARCP